MIYSIKKTIIPLPLPIHLAGFGSRTELAHEIHDSLYAGVFLLQQNNFYYAFITLDLLGIYNNYHNKIVNQIKSKLKITNLHIIFCCSHSHAAPQIGKEIYFCNQEILTQEIINISSSLIYDAINDLHEGSFSFSQKILNDLGGNRDNPELKRDIWLKTCLIKNNNSFDFIFNVNCHPTILNSHNLYVSGEFPGVTHQFLKKQFDVNALFFQGACGDISTRFYKNEASFNEIENKANYIIENIKKIVINDHFENANYFIFKEYSCTLNAKEYLTKNEYERKLNEITVLVNKSENKMKRIYETMLIGLQKELNASQCVHPKTYDVPFSILIFNNHAFVFHPFELYSTLADKIISQTFFDTCWLVGYSYNCLGYLLDEESMKFPSYEAYSSIFDKQAGETFTKKVINCLNKLKQ